MVMYRIIIALCILGGTSVSAQRVAPGVAPQHYQQQQPQHPPPPQQYQQVPQHQQIPQHQQQQQQHHQPQHQLPPGVNPQHYQPQQLQYQQVPVHGTAQQQQQVPIQQVPVVQQQQYQQVPVQQQQHHQVPVQQGHGGGHHAPHAAPGQVLNAANMAQEKDHIQEHLHVPIDTSKMSEAELQFHYFKMHDSDNNNKLDGCELIKSLIHWHADEHKEKKENETQDDEQNAEQEGGISYTDDNLAEVIDYVLNSMDLNKDGYVDYAEYRKSEEQTAKDTNKQ